MKIKQVINKKVNSFEFSFDLLKKDYLKLLLRLYEIRQVYICIFGIDKNKEEHFIDYLLSSNIQDWQDINGYEYAIKINVDDISTLLSIIGSDFDELVVWSCYTDWETFIQDATDLPFFSFKKKPSSKTAPSFYLRLDICDNNFIEIICDLEFNNGGDITKDDLLSLMEK